jgi:hypothetical protein
VAANGRSLCYMSAAAVAVGVSLVIILVITAVVTRVRRRAVRETNRTNEAEVRASLERPIERVRRRRDESELKRHWGDHDESLRDWQASRSSRTGSRRRRVWAAGTADNMGATDGSWHIGWGGAGGRDCEGDDRGGGDCDSGGCGGGGCGGGGD